MDEDAWKSLYTTQPPHGRSGARTRDRHPLPEPPPERGGAAPRRKGKEPTQPWRHFTCLLCPDPPKFEGGKPYFTHVKLHHPELLDAEDKLQAQVRNWMHFDGPRGRNGFCGERHELWTLEETPRLFAIEEKGGPR